MIDTILCDFSRVLLFPKANYSGLLNEQYKELKKQNNFHFWDHYRLNREFLGFLAGLKKNFSLNLFTTDVIQNDIEIRNQFDTLFGKIYVAREMGLSKKDPSAYINIARDLGRAPADIVFIDDSIGNIEAAREAGLAVVQYISNIPTISKVEEMLGFRRI